MLATRQQPPGTCYAVIPYRNYYDSSISVNTIISSPQHFRNTSHNTSPPPPSLLRLSSLSSLLSGLHHTPQHPSLHQQLSRLLLSPVIASMFSDQPAVSFENPARDPLGREHIGGRLVADVDALLLFWEFRHNVFRNEGPRTVRIPYDVIDAVVFRRTMGLWNPRLILSLTDPAPLAEVPGANTASATFLLSGHSIRTAASTFIKLTEFRRSEARQQRSASRLDSLTKEAGL